MLSTIEDELLEATAFPKNRPYPQRQDYLAALARAVHGLDEVDFDALSLEAATWFNNAAVALNNKKDIEEFTDDTGPTEDELQPAEGPDDEETEEGSDGEPAAAPVTKAKNGRRKGQPPRKLPHPPIKDITLGDVESIENITIDRYGNISGYKTAAATAMFEKGCRMTDVTASIGGSYYNMLRKLEKRGHIVKRGPNGMTTVIHKDDVKAKK